MGGRTGTHGHSPRGGILVRNVPARAHFGKRHSASAVPGGVHVQVVLPVAQAAAVMVVLTLVRVAVVLVLVRIALMLRMVRPLLVPCIAKIARVLGVLQNA